MTRNDLAKRDERIQNIYKSIRFSRPEFKEKHPVLLCFMDEHDFRLIVEGTTDLNKYDITLYVKSDPSQNVVTRVNYDETEDLDKMLNIRFNIAEQFFKEHASESQRQLFMYDEITAF